MTSVFAPTTMSTPRPLEPPDHPAWAKPRATAAQNERDLGPPVPRHEPADRTGTATTKPVKNFKKMRKTGCDDA
jgi:hypothetical protein